MDENDGTGPTVRERPGGRSARVRRAVLSSTIEILAERGPSAVTVDAVASAAGVNPTTIYRRWASTDALVTDALAARSVDMIPVPDTGTVRGDLLALLHDVRSYVTSAPGRALVHAVLGSGVDADVAALRQDFWNQRFSLLSEAVQRGIDRNELPHDVDPRFLIEIATAALYFRVFVVAVEVDDEQLEQIVDFVMRSATNEQG